MKINLTIISSLIILTTSCLVNVKAQAPQQINNLQSVQWYGLPNCTWTITGANILAPCISGGGSGATLQTNSVNNTSQSILNLLNASVTQGFGLTVTNSSAGNVQLGLTLSTQTANTVFAGPTSGGASAPTWRNLVLADLPTSLFTLTTTGSSGAATYVAGVLNIPQYTGGGSLPTLVANQYLTNNGTTANWGEILTGPTGALCAGVGCSGGTAGIVDVVPSIVALLANTQTFVGVDTFNSLQVQKLTVSTLPTCNGARETQQGWVTDALSPTFNATVSAGGAVHISVHCNGTNWVTP